MNKTADLIVTNPDGVAYDYVLDTLDPRPLLHNAANPNVNNNSSASNPAQAGGVYDVRDSEGDKAIVYSDWYKGAGQTSLDSDGAVASRFFSSKNVDIQNPGELRLLRAVSYTEKMNTAGPIFSALGMFWMGTANGGVRYSADNGATWTAVSITASPSINATISGFCSDGTSVYFCVATGANPGVWKTTYGTPYTATKLGTSPTTSAIRHIAYSGGFLFAATAAGAGIIDSATGAYTQKTATFLNVTNSSVALVPAGNAVYWVVCQGSRSFIYRVSFDPQSQDVSVEQFVEFPVGFIATCAIGYLSNVYTGGYYESSIADVGQGVVYVGATNQSILAPLTQLGDQPEYTQDPSAVENDNRIYAMCAAHKDLYLLTNRAVYRWDIDDGGYSHSFDFMSSGFGTQTVIWNAGSEISWDGTDLTNADPPHHRFPTGFVDTVDGAGFDYQVSFGSYVPTVQGTASWDHTGGVATMTESSGTPKALVRTILTALPTGAEELDNTTGTTLQIVVPHGVAGRCLQIEMGDGVRTMRATLDVLPDGSYYSPRAFLFLHTWDSRLGVWKQATNLDQYTVWSYVEAPGPYTLRLSLKGLLAGVSLNGNTDVTSVSTKPDTSAGHIIITMSATSEADSKYYDQLPQAFYVGNTGTSVGADRKSAIDSISLNSVSAIPVGNEIEVLSHAGIAYNKGHLVAPYSVGSDAVSMTIATSANAPSPVTITTSGAEHLADQGLVSGQVVYISGHSYSTCNGIHVATVTGDHTFTIPVTSTGGTGGTVTWNESVGVASTGTTYADSGTLESSFTTFHSGSVLKDYRTVEIIHDPLPSGATLSCSVIIDGESSVYQGETVGQITKFTINKQGYGISVSVTMTPDTSKLYTPIIKAVNATWNFVKVKRHTYALNCARGAGDDRWQGDPETAIAHLFTSANQRCTFEDRFSGEYSGAMETVELTRANYSPSEGPSGVVRIVVREE